MPKGKKYFIGPREVLFAKKEKIKIELEGSEKEMNVPWDALLQMLLKWIKLDLEPSKVSFGDLEVI